MMCISTLYKLKIAHYIAGTLVPVEGDAENGRAHLQRTINALEGPRGRHFKRTKTIGNPCHGMPGDGIIRDLERPDAVATFGPSARTAHRLAVRARDAAVRAVASTATLAQVKRSGATVARLVESAGQTLLHDRHRKCPPLRDDRSPRRPPRARK
jgi:hypothetical protein